MVATLVRRSGRRNHATGPCCTCTAFPTTSTRSSSPSSTPPAARTSTPSTCASTVARCCRTRPRPGWPTSPTTTRNSTRRSSSSSARDTTELVINAHSTGGLIAVSWLHDRRTARRDVDPVTAVVLNSPFLDVPAAWAVRALAPRPFAVLAKNRPLMVLPSSRTELLPGQHAPQRARRMGFRPGVEAGHRRRRPGRMAGGGAARDRQGACRARPGVPDPGAVFGEIGAWPGNGPTNSSAAMPCSTPTPSPGGRPGWARMSPASGSWTACTICCCPLPDVRQRVLAEIARWTDAYAR